MKYLNHKVLDPTTPGKVGVLITNLGSPDAAERGALRRYLKQFLSDPRVVEVPRLLWSLILNGIILNVRPGRSAAAYRSVWTDDGSPLMVHTRAQAEGLRALLQERYGEEVIVEFAMRYGSPAIDAVVEGMLERGVNRLLVMPLYPQYSAATSGSTFDALAAHFCQRRDMPALRFRRDYHDHEDYIGALALKIQQYQAEHGVPDKLVFSYHGVPQRYCDNGDPYYAQCQHTTQLVVDVLDLPDDSYMTCFQSRFGREPWLQPYLDETLKSLPGEGVKSVQVICPGFSADCLETLEEVAVENRDYFLEAGGESFGYIPCLNADAEHLSALAQLAGEDLPGWVVGKFE
ncbi:ferrochelatase [Mangrovimicrobium sediminis]|uniref:Ferrochelatase n=1 Tax=Mangrovimicrobium sediminis TaxID=2562682 RepID=A0A4Z0M411_9GAMM|nr:ferrochelatase [Haliea sp. SAOS-164]TGD74180.1 ferrochelatase [Haliea sp. SAOS-164]